jgi:hypothetical protein
MKRLTNLLVTASFLLLTSLSSEAQTFKSTWLTTNIGLNSNWIINQNAYGNQEMDYSTTFGLNANIGVNYFMDNKYGISTGIAYGNLGQNYGGEQGGAIASRKVHLNYIQVPVLMIRQLCDYESPCWISFGPQIMFLTSASQKYEREEGNPLKHPEYLPEGKEDVTKWYKPADLMLNFGYTKAYIIRTNDKVRMTWSINTAYGLLDINAKDYQLENIHGVYKSSHNFYIGAQFGFMFNP